LYEWFEDNTLSAGKPLISSVTGKISHEVYPNKTQNDAKTWMWAAIAVNMTSDNIRPIVPYWTAGKNLVLWIRVIIRVFMFIIP